MTYPSDEPLSAKDFEPDDPCIPYMRALAWIMFNRVADGATLYPEHDWAIIAATQCFPDERDKYEPPL